MNKDERQLYCEKQLLGILLKDKFYFDDCKIDSDYFFTSETKHLFQLLQRLKRKNTSLNLVSYDLLDENEKANIGHKSLLGECLKIITKPSEEVFRQLQDEMIAYKVAEDIIAQAERLKEREQYILDECLEISNNIQDILDVEQQEGEEFSSVLFDMRNELLMKTDELSGIDTGYEQLNTLFDGWQSQQGDLIVIGARPSMGKSALACNLALHSAKNGHEAVLIPSETGTKSFIKRLVAIHSGLPVNVMRNPKKYLTHPDDLKLFKDTFDDLNKLPLSVKTLHDVNEIRQLARKMRKNNKYGKILMIVDHLGHLEMKGVHFQNRTQEYEAYCKSLKDTARDFNIAIILLSQLSREVEKRQDKRPMNSDLRDSGSIEQIADIIMFIYRKSYYMSEEEKDALKHDEMELICTKNRDGELGTAVFTFDGECNQIRE